MPKELNREEIMHLLRLHTETFLGMLDEGNYVSKHVLSGGGGPENRGGLERINELFSLLEDKKSGAEDSGE